MSRPGLLWILVAAVTALAQTPDAAEQARALAAVREYALNYTARLPDFTCTQVTQRVYYPNDVLRARLRRDAIEEQISFVGHKESYTITKINGEVVNNVRHDQLGGIWSSGEFGTLLNNTFDPKAGTDFRWDRWANLKGRKMYVFAFRVPQSRGYGLVESRRTILVPYKGLVYAEPETGAVWRVELQCEIPKDSEFKQLDLTLDFKPTEVAGREFLLPVHFQMHSHKQVVAVDAADQLELRPGMVSETLNEADYKNYRRFDAESSITFGIETNPKQ